jgi:hypothetical protein
MSANTYNEPRHGPGMVETTSTMLGSGDHVLLTLWLLTSAVGASSAEP